MPCHADCIHFTYINGEGFCKYKGKKVDPRGRVCPFFRPKDNLLRWS